MRTRKQCVPGLGGGGAGDEACPQLVPIAVNTTVWLMGIVENMHNIYICRQNQELTACIEEGKVCHEVLFIEKVKRRLEMMEHFLMCVR